MAGQAGCASTPAHATLIDDAACAFIESQRVARLATVDARGRPHIVPICFALLDHILFTPIDEKPKAGDPHTLRRMRNIEAHPDVQVLLDEYDDEDWTRLRYLQLRGHARIIESGGEHAAAVAALRARYRQYAEMSLGSRPIIAVDIQRVVEWSWR